MKDVQIPSLGESVAEGVIVRWIKKDGDRVALDEPLLELETDKASVEIPAPAAGTIHVDRAEGETVKVGEVVARIEPATGSKDAGKKPATGSEETADADKKPATGSEDATDAGKKPEPEQAPSPSQREAESAEEAPAAPTDRNDTKANERSAAALSPAVRRLVEEHDLDPDAIEGTARSGRLSKADVLRHLADRPAPGEAKVRRDTAEVPTEVPTRPAADQAEPAADAESAGAADAKRERDADAETDPRQPTPYPAASPSAEKDDDPAVTRTPLTRLRRRIGERLLEAQRNAAILTTFNEVDMSAVLELRSRFKQPFEDRHGTRLGFMSFFAKASIAAMADVPLINARIDGDDIVQPDFVNLGIAVGTARGLVVPIVQQAHRMTFAGIEAEIVRLAALAQENKLAIADLSGGTFTISNGGVYGSLLSTPILNPPQSGILGLPKIEKRAVVIDDQIVVRPMMYLALSYDHRLIDGAEAVTFLVGVKERIEAPERLLFDL